MMRRAFTLIELLVVIAILAAILFPVFAQAKDAAKNTSALSNCKQIGTSMMIYATDADDLFPLSARSDNQGWDTWQGIIQPYTKSWDIILHPKLARPTGAQAYWQRLQHWGVPQRASATTEGAGTRGYYEVPASGLWGVAPTGTLIRVDGLFGAGVQTAGGWYGSQSAPSRSQSEIQNVSEQLMVTESGQWDMWWGIFPESSGVKPLRLCGAWVPRENWMQGGYGWSYGGPHARKKPQTDTTTSGDATGFMPVSLCAQPNGLVTYIAADTSAKSRNWRRQMTKSTLRSDGTYAMDIFNPNGN
jgi:prepilin-type N-terminal cleavage/methylation domain-containing protein